MVDPYPTLDEILSLVKDIHEGKLVLPEFQRNFVWANPDIQSLLVSLLNGYFIGTLLFVRRGESFDFKIRYFEGVNDVNETLPQEPIEKSVDRAVLDGQQRLSALFYAVYTPKSVAPKGSTYSIRYFVNVYDRLNGKDWEECIKPYSENDRTRNIEVNLGGERRKISFKELLDLAGNFNALFERQEFKQWCFENWLIPFTILKDRAKLDDWLEDFGSYLYNEKSKSYEEIKELKRKIKELFDGWFKFKVPTLTLENKSLPEVAEIFERINRTGVELSVFALATAVFFKKGINLRGWWKGYYETESPIRNFCNEDDEEFPKIILQIMALLQGKEVKKRVLVDAKQLEVDRQKWDEACQLLDNALRRIQNTISGYGVIKPDMLPYKPIITTLAGLLKYCKTDKDFKKLDVWYWSSVFTERYAGASDTAIKQDFENVKEWLVDDSKIPAVVVDVQNRIDQMDLRKSEKGALCKAILNLIALKGAKDFLTGQSIELARLNDHHVFPRQSGIKLTNENSILNRTLIQETTNKYIHKKKPSQYIKEMEEKLGGEGRVREILKSHLISDEAFSSMKTDNYEEFLKTREKEIITEMKARITMSF
ncbi:MAG: GmrSD restriction endonuclease domain-containing protein [Fervidobacterium sp.]